MHDRKPNIISIIVLFPAKVRHQRSTWLWSIWFIHSFINADSFVIPAIRMFSNFKICKLTDRWTLHLWLLTQLSVVPISCMFSGFWFIQRISIKREKYFRERARALFPCGSRLYTSRRVESNVCGSIRVKDVVTLSFVNS